MFASQTAQGQSTQGENHKCVVADFEPDPEDPKHFIGINFSV